MSSDSIERVLTLAGLFVGVINTAVLGDSTGDKTDPGDIQITMLFGSAKRSPTFSLPAVFQAIGMGSVVGQMHGIDNGIVVLLPQRQICPLREKLSLLIVFAIVTVV